MKTPSLIFTILLFNLTASQALVTVGSVDDSRCDYNSIQAAIDDANNHFFIKVAAGYTGNRIEYNENLVINREMTIIGGYDDCAAAASNTIYIDSPQVYLRGIGNGPVIKILDATRVGVHRFEISGGNGNLGGGIETDTTNVTLVDSLIHSNSSNTKGGGIHINDSGSGFDVELVNTKVITNQALLGGGGIFCGGGEIHVDKNSGVSFNQTIHASADGGGLYLNNCDLYVYGGTNDQPNPINLDSYRGISHNSANRHGGGVYASNSIVRLIGAEFTNNGDAENPANLNNNTADSDNDNIGNGGGIYAIGGFFPIEIEVYRGKVQYNTAYQGGAFYIGSNIIFNMYRTREAGIPTGIDECWSVQCSVLSHNSATSKGGALYIENGATVLLGQTHITNNRSNYGTVLSVDSTGSTNNIVLDQNFIYHNGHDGTGGFQDQSVIDMYNNSLVTSTNNLNVKIMHNTITDNHATQGVITMNGVNSYLGVFSSILNDTTSNKIGNLFATLNSTAEFDCVNVNESVSIGVSYATLTRMGFGDPGFIYRNYDYHIKPQSNVEDFCDDSRISSISTTNDIDDNTRAVDNTQYQDFYGAWDLGADENTSAQQPNDIIFIDSFDW